MIKTIEICPFCQTECTTIELDNGKVEYEGCTCKKGLSLIKVSPTCQNCTNHKKHNSYFVCTNEQRIEAIISLTCYKHDIEFLSIPKNPCKHWSFNYKLFGDLQ